MAYLKMSCLHFTVICVVFVSRFLSSYQMTCYKGWNIISVYRHQICDGRRDCDGGEDERNCFVTTLAPVCNGFECSDGLCIEKSSVCDGDFDCEDEEDEVKCGISDVPGTEEKRQQMLSWLQTQWTPSKGWGSDVHRAVVSRALGGGSKPVTDQKEELIAKQLELKVSLALLRNGTDSLSTSDLAMFINALLLTCHDPRHFYGFDLVSILKKQLRAFDGTEDPMGYLALCNANETLSENDTNRLEEILQKESEYAFLTDIKAIAILALSCMKSRGYQAMSDENSTLTGLYDGTIEEFKNLQQGDGSFGTIYTTAFISQALLSSGKTTNEDWDLVSTVKFLKSEVDKVSSDSIAKYLILPVLNSKTLADIANHDCTLNGKHFSRTQAVKNIEEKLGVKMTVQYALYIGNQRDVVHTISLKVPHNITAYEVMQLAELHDSKYKFKSKNVKGKIYIYELAGMPNDPEFGKFWLLYMGREGESHSQSPDKITVQDGEKLIMWYRTLAF